LDRFNSHAAQSIYLLGIPHAPKLCGHSRTYTANEHEGADNRTKLSRERQCHSRAYHPLSAVTMHAVVTLQSAHHAREGSSQYDQKNRLGTNEIQLSDEFMEAKGRPY
jgi:hypothetical protein